MGIGPGSFPPHGFPRFLGFESKTVKRSALCRSRRELSNEYLLAKIGFDTAENEPCEVHKFELSEILNLNFEISKLLFAAQVTVLNLGSREPLPAAELPAPLPRQWT